ncbi:MAG: hypothetical protein K0Q51_1368 [Rickettsiaceae bacterium]|nr:hypothetical protein [Rickettsiaceae bacterium]
MINLNFSAQATKKEGGVIIFYAYNSRIMLIVL